MIQFLELTPPFDKENNIQRYYEKDPITIKDWLRKRYPGFIEFPKGKPVWCMHNGRAIMRKEWDSLVCNGNDVIVFVHCQGWADLIWAIVIMAISVAISLALAPSIQPPNLGKTPEADPVYSLMGQKNKIKLNDPIEVVYGRNRLWPSYAAAPYQKYIDNQQWLYQLFCLGQGEFQIEKIQIENTNIDDFTDVEYQVVNPGETLTKFPDNVYTSVVVNGEEVFAPNEPEYQILGPFPVCGRGQKTNKIEIDMSAPRGLYLMDKQSGNIGGISVSFQAEYQIIDDDGIAIGGWNNLTTQTKSAATTTPQFWTFSLDVELNRYQVRLKRTNDKNTDIQAGNTLQWDALRSYMPSIRNYGNVTLLAVAARASNNLNSSSQNRINVIAVRKLPLWDSSSKQWTAPTPTRSIIWAYADVLRNKIYGAAMDDTYINLEELAALHDIYESNEEYFDWVFDQSITSWDAAKIIMMAGRAIPIPNGSRYTAVRNYKQTLASAQFNQENMISGSFRMECKLFNSDQYDGLEVTYVDSDTWQEETVMCLLPGQEGIYPKKFKLDGVKSRKQAYRIGMWRWSIEKYNRQNYIFSTGREGLLPFYGDLALLYNDVPDWGNRGGMVDKIEDIPNTSNKRLYLNESVLIDGVKPNINENYLVAVRKNNGIPSRPNPVINISDDGLIIDVIPQDWEVFKFSETRENPLFVFGKQSEMIMGRIQNIVPGENDTVEITCSNVDNRIFDYDAYNPPPIGDTTGGLPLTPDLPIAKKLSISGDPTMPDTAFASWIPAHGAQYYVLQYSYDGIRWTTLSDNITENTYSFNLPNKYTQFRVAGVNVAQGPWTYWMGIIPINYQPSGTGVTPGNPDGSKIKMTGGFGQVLLYWEYPTNAQISKTHIFFGTSPTRPLSPSYSITYPMTSWGVIGLEDNTTYYAWIQFEGVKSTGQVTSPMSAISDVVSAKTDEGVNITEIDGTIIKDDSISTPKFKAMSVDTRALNALAVTSDKIAAKAVTAGKMDVIQLSAICADVGLLRTASSGARLEISSTQIKVYDAAGTLRVIMGIWTT